MLSKVNTMPHPPGVPVPEHHLGGLHSVRQAPLTELADLTGHQRQEGEGVLGVEARDAVHLQFYC